MNKSISKIHLSEIAGKQILLVQPSVFKRYYQILFEDEVIGEIKSLKWYSFSIEVNCFGGSWIIYKPSFWRGTWEIKESNKQLPFASYTKERFKPIGTIELPRGQKLKINFKTKKSLCEINTIRNERLVLIKEKLSFREKIEFSIEQKSELLDKYSWVIFLAWYIAKLRKRSRQSVH